MERWSKSSPRAIATHPSVPLPSWSNVTAPWSWEFAGRCSGANRMRKTLSRRRSSYWLARRVRFASPSCCLPGSMESPARLLSRPGRSALRVFRIEGGMRAQSFDPADPSPSVEASLSRSEDAGILLEELSKLREPYRSAIVLCDLEGVSHAEAATRLNCAEGAVSARISRGRGLLKQKLLRRGLSSASPLLLSGSSKSLLDVALAPNLAQAAVQAGVAIAHKQSIAGLVSTSAALLSLEVLPAMTWTKIFVTASLAFAVGAAALGVSSAANPKHSNRQEPQQEVRFSLEPIKRSPRGRLRP